MHSAIIGLADLPAEKFLRQVSADGFVIEFQVNPRKKQYHQEKAYTYRPHFGERISVGPDPGIEQIHDRIVRHIDRI